MIMKFVKKFERLFERILSYYSIIDRNYRLFMAQGGGVYEEMDEVILVAWRLYGAGAGMSEVGE